MQNADKKRLIPELRKDLKLLPGGTDKEYEETWLLFDPSSDKYYRLGEHEYNLISNFRSGCTIPELVESLNTIGFQTTEKELHSIISFLYRSHLFYPEEEETVKQLLKEQEFYSSQKVQRVLSSYISFKIPLFKPDDFLENSIWLIKLIFNKWTVSFLIIIALWGYLQLLPNWTRFKSTFFHSLNFVGLFNYSVAIIIIKMIHEFAHAYTAKALGVRAREFGVAFIVFFPRLYTDLTDSWQITNRHKRAWIDAAGMVAELIIGGIAALIWTKTGSGPIHAIAYFIFSVSIINTLLFNGNPLMRFDGYYLLSDLINIDNLYPKAVKHLRVISRRFFWGIATPKDFKLNIMLSFYAIAAFIYRLFLYTSIIAIVYFKFIKLIGIILALIEIQQLIIRPLVRELGDVRIIMKKRKTSYFVKLAVYLAVIITLLFIPIPFRLSIPCQVKSEQRSLLYIHTAGFIDKVYVKDGQTVSQGDVVLSLKNPFMEMELENKLLEMKVLKEEMRQLTSNKSTMAQKKLKLQQMASLQTIIKELTRKLEDLKIKSKSSGSVVIYHDNIKAGKWLQEGAAYGEVYAPDKQEVIAYISEADLYKISKGNLLSIFFAKDLVPVSGKIMDIQAVPLKYIESTPLQDIYGGALKGTNDQAGWKSAQVLYQVTIKPEKAFPPNSIGRSGEATLKKSFSIGTWILRKCLNFFQKESVF